MPDAHRPSWEQRAAPWLLVAHCALIAFSTISLTTFLKGAPPPWLAEEPHATVLKWGWKLSGPTYVVLGAIAMLLHVAARIGWRRAFPMFLVTSGIALGSELLGTSTQLPFGEYHYTTLLGHRIFGLVPFPIPISWYYMIVGSLAIVGRLMVARDDNATKWKWALVGALILVAWDVSMDPAMVKTAHWVWGDGDRFASAALPAPVIAFFTKDFFYGMPLSNWFGWYLTGVIVARLTLAFAPPTMFAARLSPTLLPIVLYAVNGIMPVAICLRDDMIWGAVLGAIAMLLPVTLALSSSRPLVLSSSALE
ncbi:MAG: carotenoid biosynthesis protein [Gemmatimonadaceae bacterium]|nr:carotenoid biosynthesis protein [Gemmatimonadaceae bacterium]